MASSHEKTIDAVFVSSSPKLDGFEYSTTWSQLQRRVSSAGMKITHKEYREGKVYVTVCPRYQGVDPYLGTTTYAGYRPHQERPH